MVKIASSSSGLNVELNLHGWFGSFGLNSWMKIVSLEEKAQIFYFCFDLKLVWEFWTKQLDDYI